MGARLRLVTIHARTIKGKIATYESRVPSHIPNAVNRNLAATAYGITVKIPLSMNDFVSERENSRPCD